MSLANATVWEVRFNGNDLNGGGFVTGSSGTDYSQQDAKNTAGSNISTVNAVANGTTTITSATAAFTSAITGNIVYFQGGTGAIAAQWRQATYVNATTITIDTAIAASTGMTMNIGGAFASIGRIPSVLVGYNTVFVKYNASPYLITTTTSNVTNGVYVKSAMDTQIVGYDTNRTENNTDANRPTIKASGISTCSLIDTGNGQTSIRNLIIDGNSLTSISAMNNCYNTIFRNCVVQNCTSSAFRYGTFILCKAINNAGCTGFSGYYAFMCEATGTHTCGFKTNFSANCIGYGLSSNAFVNDAGGNIVCTNCIAYACGGIGFYGYSTGMVCINCIAEANTGRGFETQGAYSHIFLESCGAYNNTAGNLPGTSVQAIVTGNAFVNNTTGSFFNNAAGADFSLNNIAGQGALARGTGVPGTFLSAGSGFGDMGAIQHQDSGGAPANLFTRRLSKVGL